MKKTVTALAALYLGLGLPPVALADDFTISGAADTTNDGEVLDGDDTITVTETGSVTTALNLQAGLSSTGSNNILTNRGAITTSGNSSNGLFANAGAGNSNTLQNSGTVTTSGTQSSGLVINSAMSTLINSGTVTISGTQSFGLFIDGNANTLINSGTVTANGNFGAALASVGSGNTVTNSGTVTTDGNFRPGLSSAGSNNILTNRGSITTNGTQSSGLEVVNVNSNTLINSGTVTTSAPGSIGIRISNSSMSTVINSGTVTTSGNATAAVTTDGAGNTVTNSGTIISEQGSSIRTGGTDATVNLLAGSVLVGDVEFQTHLSATLNFGAGLNAVVRTDGPALPGTITSPGPNTVVGDTVYVADLDDYAVQDRTGGTASRLIHDAVAGRGLTPTVTQGPAGTRTWASVSGALLRDATGHDGLVVSGSFGRDRVDGPGIFAGISLSQSTAGSGMDTQAIGLHGGIYGQWGGADFTLAGGLSYGEMTRERANNTLPTGLEQASDSYLSAFFSPALTWHDLLGQGSSLRLRYTGMFHGAHEYDYAGDGDLQIDSRFSHQVEARVAWATALDIGTLRYGLDLGYQSGGSIGLTLAGDVFSTTAGGDGAFGRAFVGMDFNGGGFEIAIEDNRDVSVSANYTWRF
ncbi:MAG: hypothetical protein RIB61_07060 [Roseicyclus sp.]